MKMEKTVRELIEFLTALPEEQKELPVMMEGSDCRLNWSGKARALSELIHPCLLLENDDE